MKKFYLFLIIVLAFSFHTNAQWTTGTSLIYYTGGYVGVGTSSPIVPLHVVGTTTGLEQLRLGADLTNSIYAKFLVSSTGSLTITPGGANPTTVITGNLATGSTSSNLYVGSAASAAQITATQYQFGATTTYVRVGLGGINSPTIAAAGNYSCLNVASSPISLGTSVTVPFAASAVINPVGAITVGSGSSVTNTATLYIDGPSVQGTGANYALYSTSGLNYFGGSVGIGTINTHGFQFAVAGSAIATSVTVQSLGSWPDYVFKKDYRLAPLASIKTYVDQNHHLPDMPSAQQLQKGGLNLGDMDKLLVKKVEELTLYMIEKDSEIKDEKAKNMVLENKLNVEQEEINLLKQQVQSLIKLSNKN